MSHTLCQVASNGERSRFPLFHDVPILMEHQPRVTEEIRGAAPKVDAAEARCGHRPAVETHEPGVLEDPHVLHRALEQHFQRSTDLFRQTNCASEPCHGKQYDPYDRTFEPPYRAISGPPAPA